MKAHASAIDGSLNRGPISIVFKRYTCVRLPRLLLDKLCRVLEKHAGQRSGMPAAAKTTSAQQIGKIERKS